MSQLQSYPEDVTEQKKHLQSIENLSGMLDIPRESIVAIYERELFLMGSMVRVRDFLPILVSRRVKYLFQSDLNRADTGQS